MSYRLVAKDAEVQVASGGQWTGTNTVGTATTVTTLARSVRCEDIGDVLTIEPIGGGYRYHRPGKQYWRVEAEFYINSTGILPLSKGDVAALTLDPLATTSTSGSYTYTGIVERTSLEVSGNDNLQRVTIVGPAEGIS